MPASPDRTLWILWAAMLFAVLNYVIIAQVITLRPDPSLADSVPLITAVLGAISVANLACAMFLAPVLGRMFRSYHVLVISRFAFLESIAVLGLVLLFLGAEQPVFYGFVGASAVGLALAAPSQSGREAMERQLR
jgi:hypothetical protein